MQAVSHAAPATSISFFATAPRGVPPLLMDELGALGAVGLKETPAGVAFRGNLETAYRACLWSRTASRILMPLAEFPAASPEELYSGVHGMEWERQLAPSATLAVNLSSVHSNITHSRFGALKVKDAIVDRFREQFGVRPSVDTEHPDLRINVFLHRNRAAVSLDLSGDSLHRRGYRRRGVAAPLKENLAAALLLRAGWPALARTGAPFVDPMCGSGTLPIEAAFIAADIAPGLLRESYGFMGWLGHDAGLWEGLTAEARERRRLGMEHLPPIYGFDADPRALDAAGENVRAAGLEGRLHIEQGELAALTSPLAPTGDEAGRSAPGLLLVNPPYGERIGDKEQLRPLYQTLGEVLRRRFIGWKAAVFSGNPDLAFAMDLHAVRSHRFYNGSIECALLRFEVDPKRFVNRTPGRSLAAMQAKKAEVADRPAEIQTDAEVQAAAFANRLRKNLKTLGRWARREDIRCYRVYDADVPEYALAVDLYYGERLWVHVQEYEAPKTIERDKAKARLYAALDLLPGVLGVPPEQVYFKVRRRQKGAEQYRKLEQQGQFHQVEEGGLRFLVNFSDYLDTGLFLDHRLTRALIRELAPGRRFLNLFAYTGTASVYAAAGGALATTTVDMSKTYLDWAKRNMGLNGFAGPEHELVQADCLRWLQERGGPYRARQRYGLIFLDPPTFSTSKRMDATLDIQRDHVELLTNTAALLEPDGVLIFSNNYRRFRMDTEALAGLQVENISRVTLPKDFERNPRIHNCWRISKKF